MKRMALSLAALFVLASALLYLFGLKAVLILGGCLCVAAGAYIIYNHKVNLGFKPAAVLIIGAVFCLYLNVFNDVRVERAEALAGSSYTAVCRVVEEPEYYAAYTRLKVETDGTNGFDGALGGRVKLFVNLRNNSEGSNAVEGDILKLDLSFSQTDDIYKKYYKSQNVFISANCDSAEIIGHKESVYTRCVQLRRAVRKSIDFHTDGDITAILEGLLLGGTDKMSDELYSQFKACGVTHITAVSGMHISSFCTMLLSLLNLKLKRRKAAALTVIPMALTVMLAGLTASAVRAGIMCGILLMSEVLLKKGDSLNSLGIAVTVMLVFNPFNICNLSFQLSCSAAAGVILISPYALRSAERAAAKIKRESIAGIVTAVIMTFLQSVGAVVCTLPFQILEFGYISLISPIASVFICSAAVCAMGVCIVGVIFYYLPLLDYLAVTVFFVARFLAEYIRAVVSILAGVPFSYIAFGGNYVILWLGASMTAVAIWMLFYRRIKVKAVAFLISLMLVVSLWAEQISNYNTATVSVLDVGDGLCTVVTFDGSCVIIGCGDDYSDSLAVSDYLKKSGIDKIDVLLIPSGSQTCYGGFDGFIKKLSPKAIAVPENFGSAAVFSGQGMLLTDQSSLSVGDRGLSIKTHFADVGCVYEITVCGRKAIIGCSNFDSKTVGTDCADILISGRAAPIDFVADISVISAEMTENLSNRSGVGRKIATAGHSISIRFKEGKEMDVYAR